MKFWQVAVAALMFKTLEIFWIYAANQMTGQFDLAPFLIATVAWVVLFAILWVIAREIAAFVAQDRSDDA